MLCYYERVVREVCPSPSSIKEGVVVMSEAIFFLAIVTVLVIVVKA